MREKTIKGWIVIDWKENPPLRTRKSKPGSLGTNELLAKLSIDVEIPDVDVPELALQIDVPEPQVHAATLEALDDEELPDWTDTANEIVSDHADQFRSVDRTDMRGLVDQLTTQVLVEVNTRPDPERVREYIRRTAQRVVGGDE